MDAPGDSAPGTPLQPLPDDRISQRENMFSSVLGASHHKRDSVVSDKISQFNSLAAQSKHLERKTADAALKRAMLGREEAEGEMRRYRQEAQALRKLVEEGKDRERRVGERLETVMEKYGQAKETHTHTQAVWEKEIRRARKETFKSQSVIVKLQEELKSARASQKTTEEDLEREKERSKAREQEAFQARYELVSTQEQLGQSQERIKVLEQERDAFKSLAKSEEDLAQIAAEGKLPLPKPEVEDEDDEFASPKKKARVSSISIADVKSSAATEAELEDLTRRWQWEKQRADRALDQVEFLEAECRFNVCSCARKRPRKKTMDSPRKRPALNLGDGADAILLGSKGLPSPEAKLKANIAAKKLNLTLDKVIVKEEPRRSTIFVPEEGVFRTVSQEEAKAPQMQAPVTPTEIPESTMIEAETPAEPTPNPVYARTPSAEPPSYAQRTSLMSMLNAPHSITEPPVIFHVPTTPGPVITGQDVAEDVVEMEQVQPVAEEVVEMEQVQDVVMTEIHQSTTIILREQELNRAEVPPSPEHPEPEQLDPRPHTSAACYAHKTTTTKVPLREENTDPSLAKRIMASQKNARTPSKQTGSNSSTFDKSDPALTPTMSREEALAKIRERRGRARSAMGGAITPRKQQMEGVERRDLSAPVGRAVSGAKRPRS